MKKLFILLLITLPFTGYTQTINASFMHDGLMRDYVLYIPTNYSNTQPTPLVLNFHGFTGNGPQQFLSSNFKPIADTAGFIVVSPTGSKLPPANLNHWNVGGWTNASATNDVSFASALIDSIAAKYNIDLMRVYATGMSNGGFFSHKLAFELSNRIAAIASVSGTFTPQMQANRMPVHPTPVLQIHGTADVVVPYNGTTANGGMASVDTVLNYWIQYNNCNPTPSVNALPDLNTADGSTVEHMVYSGGDAGVTVELLKISNGGHDWPGVAGNMDISASLEIWKFFSKYTNTALATSDVTNNLSLEIYPNPTNGTLYYKGDRKYDIPYEVYSIIGKRVHIGVLKVTDSELKLSLLPKGVYFLRIGQQAYRFIKNE